jgi:hypothetical protein
MELYLYGLETTLDEIIDDLDNALGNNNSKKYKVALWLIIQY